MAHSTPFVSICQVFFLKRSFQDFSVKTEDIYKNVEFRTKGFTRKVPEVQIMGDAEKNEVRLNILAKATREIK